MSAATAPPTPRLLSIKEAAEHVGVHPDTIRRAIRAGQLPARRVGGPTSAIRIVPSELEAFLAPTIPQADPIDDYIEALADGAPELTAEQRDRLAGIFAASRKGGDST